MHFCRTIYRKRFQGIQTSKPASASNARLCPGRKNSFDKSELLSAREAALRSQLQNWTAMAADTAGFLRLANAKDVPALHSLSSRIRASRFAKGKVSISSTSMADVLLNGVSVLKKTTSDSTATSQDAPITLNPETDYDIQVNILSLPDDKSEPQFKLEFIPDDHFSDVEIKSGADIRKRFNLDQTSLGKRASGVLPFARRKICDIALFGDVRRQ